VAAQRNDSRHAIACSTTHMRVSRRNSRLGAVPG
jgi:hypothetical protein